MINRLKLEDICIINKVNQPEAKMYYLEFVETPSTDTSYPTLGLQPVEKHFVLDKKYDSNTNETILNELIHYFHIGYNGADFEGRFVYEFDWLEKPTETDLRKIITKIQMSSNKIAMEGRIGPANSVVFDTDYIPLFDKIDKLHGTMGFNFFHYPGLDNKVIIFRKNSQEHANYILVHDEQLYDFQEVGDYSKQYNVLTLKCKRGLRQKKLQRILK